jgi:hypothetical protein
VRHTADSETHRQTGDTHIGKHTQTDRGHTCRQLDTQADSGTGDTQIDRGHRQAGIHTRRQRDTQADTGTNIQTEDTQKDSRRWSSHNPVI